MNRALAVLIFLMTPLVAVYAGYPPNISFRHAPSIPVGDGPIAVAVGDFNNDGVLDLAVVSSNHNSAGAYLGQGDGTFVRGSGSPRATDASLTLAGAVGDFNGDGKLDIIATDIPGGLTAIWNSITGSIGGNASIFLGDGSGQLSSHQDSDVGADFPSNVAVGDFNGDGKLDLAITNLNSNSVSILLGHGDGSFADAIHIGVGHRPTSVAVADFDHDGKLDLAVVNAEDNTISILFGQGDGSFVRAEDLSVFNRPIAVTVGDFNEDGKADLAIAGLLSSDVIVYLGDGMGRFPVSQSFGVGRHPTALAVGDFNNDGHLDIAVANRLSDSVSVLLGNGDGTFKSFRSFSVESDPVSLVGGDFNQDGKLDLAVANLVSNTVTVLLNDTDLTPPTLQMPVLAARYPYLSTLAFTFGATDTGSGVDTIKATLNGVSVTNGQTVTLDRPGINTFVLTATDKVGNTATQSATFAVTYNFLGFMAPIPSDGTGLFKLGRTIPVKFQLSDANGNFVSMANAKLTVQQVSGNTVTGTPIDASASGSSDTGNLFRYDSMENEYIYNLSTQPFSLGTWQIQVHLNDGTVHSVMIGLK